MAIKQAHAQGLANFSVFCNHVLTPAAISNILESPEVRKLGTESIATGAGPVQATHYAVTGGLNRDLWYAGGKLVHVRFAAEDGSVIDYTLR